MISSGEFQMIPSKRSIRMSCGPSCKRCCASPAPPAGQPARLARLKAQIALAGPNRLFPCLTADVPADNNRVDRDLRLMLRKRKRSYGSKSQPGARALATVVSVCAIAWRTNPSGYFQHSLLSDPRGL